MRFYLFFCFYLFLITNIFSQAGKIDPTFDINSGFNSDVRSSAIQSNGQVVFGGFFSSFDGIACNRIARLNLDGSFDAGFNIGSGFNGYVYSVNIQADQKIIVGGDFTSFNGIICNKIARLNPDGTFDSGFNIGSGIGGPSVYCTYIQNDDKILVGGLFSSFNGTSANKIVRLNANGTRDIGFTNSIWNSTIFTLNVQNDGNIIVGGDFTTLNGSTQNKIARLNSDGTLDISFNPGSGFNSPVSSTAILSDNRILIVGYFTLFDGSPANRIVALNADGSLDLIFNPGIGFNDGALCIKTDSDEKIIVGGQFTSYNGSLNNRITRLNLDGSLDADFNTGMGFNNWVHCISLQADEKIIVGGSFTNFDSNPTNRAIRLQKCFLTSVTTDGGGVLTASLANTYQWVDCDNDYAPIINATLQSFTPTQNGNYSCIGTNAAGCSNTSNCISIDFLNYEDFHWKNPNIYPNPAEKSVEIDFYGTEASLLIIDSQGKIINNTIINQHQHYAIDWLVPGVYFFQITSEVGTFTQKLIKTDLN